MTNFSAPLFLQSNPIQEWQKDRVRLELNLDCHLLLILQLIMASFFFFGFFKSFHRFFAFVADCGITDISQRISTVIISCHISLFFFGKDFMSHLITWVFFFFFILVTIHVSNLPIPCAYILIKYNYQFFLMKIFQVLDNNTLSSIFTFPIVFIFLLLLFGRIIFL